MAPSKAVQVAANKVAKAWRGWDERPGDEGRVRVLSDAIDELAPHLGMNNTEFRNAILVKVRAGADMITAIREVVDPPATEEDHASDGSSGDGDGGGD